MSFCGVSHVTIDNIQSVLTLIISIITLLGLLAGAGFALWQRKLYKKLLANQVAIEKKQAELDQVDPDVTARTRDHLVNEKQRMAQVNAGRAPLLHDLERLNEQRDFIKDVLLFAKK